jgi:hypothetical protein
LSLDEFREIAHEVFIEKKEYPKGCNDCQSTIEWDCEQCGWRDNWWKYEELKMFALLHRAKSGGLDLNRMSLVTFDDFLKLSIIDELKNAIK